MTTRFRPAWPATFMAMLALATVVASRGVTIDLTPRY